LEKPVLISSVSLKMQEMNILSDEIKRTVQNKIIQPLLADNTHRTVDKMLDVLADLYAAIPDNKRISYGRVHYRHEYSGN